MLHMYVYLYVHALESTYNYAFGWSLAIPVAHEPKSIAVHDCFVVVHNICGFATVS